MAFGGMPSTPAFGSGGLFGQQQQQQQQSGGLFGSKPQQSGSLFGSSTPNAFGASAPQQSNAFGTPAFGASSTSAGAGSLFSSTPAKPTTSFSFGTSTPAATPAQSTPFGGGSAFGGGAPAFGGAAAGAFGTTAAQPAPIPQNGTASLKSAFTPVQEKDPKDKFVDKPTHAWYHVCYMDEFKNASPEELRWQDYQQGRKDKLKQPPEAAPQGFGATGGMFGQSNGGFGSPAGGNAFGKPAGNTFGQPASGGMFGQPAQAQAQSNPFAPQQQQSPFGQSTSTSQFGATGGAFGQTQQQQNQSPFGQNKPNAFGTSSPGNAFGQTGNTSGFGGTSSGFSFGANKPAASSPFGGGASTASPAFGQQSSSPFGQAQQQPQQQQQSNPFSFGQNAQNNTTQTPFGQTSSSGQQNSMFGGQQNQSGGFSFGQNSNQQQTQQNNSPFGGGGGTSTFGGFGQNNQQQQQQSGGGLFSFGSQNASTPAFGSGTTSQAPATGTLFGQSQPQQQQSGNLFGQSSTANTTGGGGFSFGGTNQAQSQPQQNSSLFSFGANKPATGGAAGGFGSGGGMFSSTNTQNQQPAQGGTSLFGGGLGQSQPQQNTGSMFGGMGTFGKSAPPSSQPQAGGGLFSFGQSTNTGGGLLGASQPPQGQAPNLNASPYGASPLFSSVQSKPAPAPFASDASANDKALFSRSPVPGPRAQNTPKSFNKITRIRFMTPSASNPALNDRTGSPSLGDVNFGPGTFSARSNIKRLELDRKSSLGDLRSKSASVPPSATNSPRALLGDKSMFLAQPASGSKSDRVAIDPVADATASPGQLNLTLRLRKDKDTAAPTPPPRTLTPAKTRHGHTRSPTVEGDVTTSEKASEYVCSPPIAELERFSPSELARVENLKVERPGFGSLTWREPVDLTGLESLDDLVGGQLIQIDGSGVELYQNMDYPNPGEELNKSAMVTIENVWPKDRSTGQRGPTKDADALAHHRKELKKRLKKFQGSFVDYDESNGRWTFTVPFFWDGQRK